MKSNKNGFTLVELLAVIVILALIMIIAIPSVMTVVNNARRQSFYLYAESIQSKALAKYQQDIGGLDAVGANIENCTVYDIQKDLDIRNTGEYTGFVKIGRAPIATGNENHSILLSDTKGIKSAKYCVYNSAAASSCDPTEPWIFEGKQGSIIIKKVLPAPKVTPDGISQEYKLCANYQYETTEGGKKVVKTSATTCNESKEAIMGDTYEYAMYLTLVGKQYLVSNILVDDNLTQEEFNKQIRVVNNMQNGVNEYQIPSCTDQEIIVGIDKDFNKTTKVTTTEEVNTSRPVTKVTTTSPENTTRSTDYLTTTTKTTTQTKVTHVSNTAEATKYTSVSQGAGTTRKTAHLNETSTAATTRSTIKISTTVTKTKELAISKTTTVTKTTKLDKTTTTVTKQTGLTTTTTSTKQTGLKTTTTSTKTMNLSTTTTSKGTKDVSSTTVADRTTQNVTVATTTERGTHDVSVATTKEVLYQWIDTTDTTAVNTDLLLESLVVEPYNIGNFTPTTFYYSTKVPNDVTSVKVRAVPMNKDGSTVVQITGDKGLAKGGNIVNVILTDTKTGKEQSYKIHVTRLEIAETNATQMTNTTVKPGSETGAPDPKLEQSNAQLRYLKVAGYQLTFSSDVYNYKLKVDNLEDLKLSYEPLSPFAMAHDMGNSDLKNGSVVVITVISQNGYYQKDYTIEIEYDAPDSVLTKTLKWFLMLLVAILIILVIAIYVQKQGIRVSNKGEKKAKETNEVPTEAQPQAIDPNAVNNSATNESQDNTNYTNF